MNDTTSDTANGLQRTLAKVPEITLYFWIAKLLTTAMGEATSDYLVFQINPFLAVGLGALGLVVSLILQFSARRYVAWIYWLVCVMVSIFGTMTADVVHVVLGVPYMISTLFFSIVLAIIFITWYKVEGTLSIHSIYTKRREVFYWCAVLATFALGTAAGDMTAVTMNLGFLSSAVLFVILLAIPGLCYGLVGLNAIFAFWFAYIMTRPVGASFADWFGLSHSSGGLGFGRGPVSIVLTLLIIIVVGYLQVTRRDVNDARVGAAARGR